MKNPADDRPARSPLAGGSGDASAPSDEATLWLVSFSEDEDRELRAPEIAQALRRGEIDGETIVWREGFADWVALKSVPALAPLLPTSGATANAPLVVPRQGSTTVAPVLASADSLLKLALASPADGAMKPAPSAEAKPAPKPEPQPSAPAAKTAALGRGNTRLGLPKPPEVKRVALTGPGANAPEAAAPKAASSARTLDAPKVGAPRTPNAPRVSPARTPDAPKVAGARTPDPPKADHPPASKRGAASIWDDEDDETMSVDPESIRPMSPTPGLANATALSRGTLGELPKKPPPTPRKGPKPPPRAPGAPARAPQGDESVTAPLVARTTTPTSAGKDDDFLGGGDAAPVLAAPVDFAAAFAEDPTFSAERPPLDAFDVPMVDDETATVPTATEVAPRPAAANAVATALGAAPAAPTKKQRSSVPLVLGGLAVAGVLALVLGQFGSKPAPAPEVGTPAATTAAPEPARVGAPELAAPTPTPTEPSRAAAEPSPAPPVASAATAEPVAPAAAAATTTRVVGSKAEPSATKAEPVAAKEPKAATDKPAGAPRKAEPVAAAPEPKQVDMGGDFDQGAARTALAAAAAQASGCRKDGDPSGTAVVHVTFANSGRATRATIEGPPFAGTPTGGCIAAALRGAQVPPFGGDRVTVTKRVVIH